MTKSQPSTVRAVTSELGTIKEMHPQSPCDTREGSLSQQPVSVIALASAANAAAQRGSGRKPTASGAHSHRRSQTIVAAGDLEMEIIQKHKAVEDLHTELEFKNKALEESQEEAQLAARIGQTLLQRNQEMGAESECKAIELQNRAESAEQVVKVLEQKLSLAVTQIRSLDIARTRATLEAEQLTQELEDSRTEIHGLKADMTRANEEIERIQASKTHLEEQLEIAQSQISTVEATKRKIQMELSAKRDRIEVLESVERYNVEHISRLEIENQSICHQQHVLAHRERQLQLENDVLVAKMAGMTNVAKEQQTRSQELENAIILMHNEMEDLREALSAEQTRVAQLTHINQEIEACLDHQGRVRDHVTDQGESSAQMLRNGSLFFELSRQIREEMQGAKAQRAKQNTSSLKGSLSPEESSVGQTSELESPCRSSTRTSRNPSSNNTDSLNEVDDPSDSVTKASTRASCLPPLQLERRRSQQEEAELVRAAVAATRSPRSIQGRGKQHEGQEDDSVSDDDDDILLKEFFVLTAAAVKIAGGGLRNDACNIHNEDLYAEAMAQNITFDQFHKWLERRLEDELEIILSPPKTAPLSSKPALFARGQSQTEPTPASARRTGIISFWSR